MWGDLEREPGHLVGILRPGQLVHRVQEDEERPVQRGELEQLLEVGGDGDRVVRDVLEGEHVAVADLLADGLQERAQSRGVWRRPTEPTARFRCYFITDAMNDEGTKYYRGGTFLAFLISVYKEAHPV